MNKRQVKRKLEDLVQKKPQITQPGRLLGHVLNEIGVEDDSTRKVSNIVAELLEDMATSGIIQLGMSGSVMNSYSLTQAGRCKLGMAEKTQPVVSQPESRDMMKTSADMPVCLGFAEMPQWERANLALAALRERADEQGRIYGIGLVELLSQSLQISVAQAKDVNKLLGRLGLRTSPQGRAVNKGAVPHRIDMMCGEVTRDMVDTPTATQEEIPPMSATAVKVDALASLMDVTEELEARVAEQQELIERLQANLASGQRVVDVLREENETLASQALRSTQAIEDLQGKVTELKSENSALAEQLSFSNRQLLASRAESNPRLMEILARNGKV